MKSTTLRNKFAAVLLLAPVAAAVIAARPAHAQQIQITVPGVVAVQDHRGYGYGYDRGYRQDHRAPRITDVTPDNGGRVSERGITELSARVHDRGGSGIDPRGISLRLDGRDVTRRANFDGNEVSYRENLQPGRHFAELVVRDRAGNITREAWSFDVTPREWDRRGDRYGWYNGR
jgi:hypothetical protein